MANAWLDRVAAALRCARLYWVILATPILYYLLQGRMFPCSVQRSADTHGHAQTCRRRHSNLIPVNTNDSCATYYYRAM